MRCAVWYYLYNLKNVKNTHGGALILIKLQAEACKLKIKHNWRTETYLQAGKQEKYI